MICTLTSTNIFSVVVRIAKGGDSSASIVSDYELDDRAMEVRSPAEAKEFFL
jgi:hypothetical protein